MSWDLSFPPAAPRIRPVCPRCFCTDTVPIWYGLPTPECFAWDRQGSILTSVVAWSPLGTLRLALPCL